MISPKQGIYIVHPFMMVTWKMMWWMEADGRWMDLATLLTIDL